MYQSVPEQQRPGAILLAPDADAFIEVVHRVDHHEGLRAPLVRVDQCQRASSALPGLPIPKAEVAPACLVQAAGRQCLEVLGADDELVLRHRDAREHPVQSMPAIEGGLPQPLPERDVEPPHRLDRQAGVARGYLGADALAEAVDQAHEGDLVELRARLELVVASGDAAARFAPALTRLALRNCAISSA